MTQGARSTGWLVWTLAVGLMAAGCQQQQTKPAGPVEKKIRANVMTIRTTAAPSNRKSTHTIVIGGTVARSTADGPVWRLYDFRNNRVFTVDDLEKTYRSETLSSLAAARQQRFRKAGEEPLPRVSARATGATRAILSVPSSEIVISAGAYKRQLWFGPHPKVPPQLFAMMHIVSDTTPSQAMRQADEFLASTRGFPLVDRTELPYGTATMVIERVVESVLPRDVPASLLAIPAGYRDVTVTAPAARPPASSSRPRGRTAPAAESQSSSTTQTAP